MAWGNYYNGYKALWDQEQPAPKGPGALGYIAAGGAALGGVNSVLNVLGNERESKRDYKNARMANYQNALQAQDQDRLGLIDAAEGGGEGDHFQRRVQRRQAEAQRRQDQFAQIQNEIKHKRKKDRRSITGSLIGGIGQSVGSFAGALA